LLKRILLIVVACCPQIILFILFFKKDDEEIAKGKNFDSKINQSHGFTFGEGNSNKKNYTKSANTVSNMMTSQEDDAHQKLTAPSTYEIKIRKRRACQLKALVILVALFAAVCIGCIMAYFFIKYNNEHERYVKYTQYMVAERNCKCLLFELIFF
jgi:flagellar basal body-associated protein FliL